MYVYYASLDNIAWLYVYHGHLVHIMLYQTFHSVFQKQVCQKVLINFEGLYVLREFFHNIKMYWNIQ